MVVVVVNWWVFVFRGILAVLFGLICCFMPGIALTSLVLAFGVYALIDGVLHIIAAFRRSDNTQRPGWGLLLGGIISIAAGATALFRPGITAVALLYLIAAWVTATGIMSIAAAVRLRKQISGEWVLVLSGTLSILFGVLAAIFPGAGALAVILWIGAYSIASGILLISLGVKLRQWINRAVAHIGHGFSPRVAPGH